MNIKAIAFSSLLAVSTFSSPAFSQTSEIDVSKIPTINNSDWRTPSKFAPPWSTPVLVNDEFDGSYLSVYDHNFQKVGGLFGLGSKEENGMTSEWSPNRVRVYSYIMNDGGTTIKETSKLIIKVGGKMYTLTGEKGNFVITPELAYALKTAPMEVAKIRIQYADSGIEVTSDIGTGTVTAWRTVYQKAQDPSQASSGKSKINDATTASSSEKPRVNQSMAASSEKPKAKAKLKRKH